jgi:hypothetical protein
MRVLCSTRPVPSSRVLAAITPGLAGAVKEVCWASACRPMALTVKMLKKILVNRIGRGRRASITWGLVQASAVCPNIANATSEVLDAAHRNAGIGI